MTQMSEFRPRDEPPGHAGVQRVSSNTRQHRTSPGPDTVTVSVSGRPRWQLDRTCESESSERRPSPVPDFTFLIHPASPTGATKQVQVLISFVMFQGPSLCLCYKENLTCAFKDD